MSSIQLSYDYFNSARSKSFTWKKVTPYTENVVFADILIMLIFFFTLPIYGVDLKMFKIELGYLNRNESK